MQDNQTTPREQAIAELRKCQAKSYGEGHERADKALCKLLKALGYADVVAEWKKVSRNYE